MKLGGKILISLLLISLLTACSTESVSEEAPGYDQEVYQEITITAGDSAVNGVLFDNETARDLADCLPLTVPLWVPADFAKAFTLDRESPLYDSGIYTREYQVGGLAYWPNGTAVAIFHGDRDETAVPVIIIGKLEDDVSIFADYKGEITLTTREE